MKLVTFSVGEKKGWGVVIGDGIVDGHSATDGRFSSIREMLKTGALPQVAQDTEGRQPDFALSEVAFLPVIPDPEKIFCLGVNYILHREETGHAPTEHPTVFARFANSQVGHGQPILRPSVSERLDFEGELAVIIGKAGRHISEDQALDHVAGYSCYNDGSVRDWQRHTSQWIPGKNFVATGAFGPWLVTSDEMPDVTKASLVTRLNGEEMQRAEVSDMIFSIPATIAYLSTFSTLSPGDVIVTGTPGGVGHKRNPPLFMKPGDVVEVEISGIGTLRNTVQDDT